MEHQGKTIEDLAIGDRATISREIREEDINDFAQVTGDRNPLHLDEAYAKDTIFKGRIAHGMLCASLISSVIGMRLPGPGTVYLSQTLHFRKAVRINDTITVQAEVKEIDATKGRVTLYTVCRNQEDKVVLEGAALVMPRRAGE